MSDYHGSFGAGSARNAPVGCSELSQFIGGLHQTFAVFVGFLLGWSQG